jgi:hypothetical protein
MVLPSASGLASSLLGPGYADPVPPGGNAPHGDVVAVVEGKLQPREELLMTRRCKVWRAVAVLFTLVNFAGGVFAALGGELLHAGTHVALVLLGAYAVSRLTSSRSAPSSARPGELGDRLARLGQSLDAIAIEVERIGEGQRFMTRLFTENGTARAADEGAPEPIDIDAREPAQLRRY